MKILLTTTSFQDTPGKHHELLKNTGFEIDELRGPVKEEVLLPIIHKYDGVICGDDAFTRNVIKKGKENNLKVISKYGVGLDKIDLDAAKEFDIPIHNTPGVNQITVAEHVIALIMAVLKNIPEEFAYTKNGKWKRLIGTELYGKKVGIFGLGKIGKELAKRLSVFGVQLFAFDIDYDDNFMEKYSITKTGSVKSLIQEVDILSINSPLTKSTKGIINNEILDNLLSEIIIINTSRALIIDQDALFTALKLNKIKAYITDVMDEEPMSENNTLKDLDNVYITPHIGSRTFESVERQGSMAVENLIKALK